jgi:DNA-binding MurR/RpiR family transcriptional regulator
MQAHVAQSIANLEATFLSISDSQITAVTDAMMAARKVWVIGFRSSHPFASYLQWQLTQVIEDIVAVPAAGQTLGEHFVSLREDDVVVFFALRRRTAQADAILTQVRKSKAKLLYVTDEGAPFDTRATWHMQCQTFAPAPSSITRP